MPNEEEQTIVDSGGEEEDKPKKAKAGGNKLIMFGGIGLGAIIIGVVLALFVVKPMLSDSGAEGDETSQVEEAEDGGHGASADDHAKPKKKPKKKKKKSSGGHGEAGESDGPILYAMKDIVVNPAGTGGTRFLSVSFGFELESSDLKAEMEMREAMVRDALITILSSKTVAQLTDAKQKEITRYQIKKRLSQLMDTDELAGVYYTDFVLQ